MNKELDPGQFVVRELLVTREENQQLKDSLTNYKNAFTNLAKEYDKLKSIIKKHGTKDKTSVSVYIAYYTFSDNDHKQAFEFLSKLIPDKEEEKPEKDLVEESEEKEKI